MKERDKRTYKGMAGLAELMSDIGMMVTGPSYAFYVSPHNYSTLPHHIGAVLFLLGFSKAMIDLCVVQLTGEDEEIGTGVVGTAALYTGKGIKKAYDKLVEIYQTE